MSAETLDLQNNTDFVGNLQLQNYLVDRDVDLPGRQLIRSW
jgi:hypothetical protein